MAVAQLADVRHLILAGARLPVSFFAYPGKPSELHPAGSVSYDIGGSAALAQLADLVAAGAPVTPAPAARPDLPDGSLTPERIAAVVGALLPEGAIVADEAITSGRSLAPATAGCPPHDWLSLTGGAIGQGMPVATGAAVACPDRPVINLQAEGSAMYTLQSLWTQAREGLNVLTIVFANRIYQILRGEFDGVGAGEPGQRAQDMLKLDRPTLDFVSLARGMGVQGRAVTTADEFVKALDEAMAENGPRLIEVQF
jgi:acetolactate synthase-1/2/3 large subunit